MEGLIEALFELVLETFGELILQVVLQALTEAGVHLTRQEKQEEAQRSPLLRLLGYALLGSIAGSFSLLVFSQSLAHTHNGRLATLLLVPLLAALCSVLMGRLRVRKGQTPADIDRFMYAYLFALAMACVRYVYAS